MFDIQPDSKHQLKLETIVFGVSFALVVRYVRRP
jgi:hypothetical protein